MTKKIPKHNDKLKRKLKIKEDIELNEKQKEFLDISLTPKNEIIFCSGPAGTSKTFLSILAALQLLNTKLYTKILYVRSAVESADSKLGFLPGEEAMKLEPYLRPLRDKLQEFLTPTDISQLYAEGKIDAEHVGYARGQDWKNMVIVIDEAQNLSEKELLTLITRCGRQSKVFLLGDPMQSDIGHKSGFNKYCDIFNTEKSKQMGIQFFKFTTNDIVRNPLVKFIIEEIEKYKESQQN